jgi:flagellar biosynthesis GTPase FlhF
MNEKYERSGNGSGQRAPDSDDIAGDGGEILIEGNDRSNLLGDNQPHLLYFWHLMEISDALANTIGVVAADSGASAEYVAVTERGRLPRQKKGTENKETETAKLFQMFECLTQSQQDLALESKEREERNEARAVEAALELKEREERIEARAVEAALELKEREERNEARAAKLERRAEFARLEKRVDDLELQLTTQLSQATISVLEKQLVKAKRNLQEFVDDM